MTESCICLFCQQALAACNCCVKCNNCPQWYLKGKQCPDILIHAYLLRCVCHAPFETKQQCAFTRAQPLKTPCGCYCHQRSIRAAHVELMARGNVDPRTPAQLQKLQLEKAKIDLTMVVLAHPILKEILSLKEITYEPNT
jgi:hypothetical protein